MMIMIISIITAGKKKEKKFCKAAWAIFTHYYSAQRSGSPPSSLSGRKTPYSVSRKLNKDKEEFSPAACLEEHRFTARRLKG